MIHMTKTQDLDQNVHPMTHYRTSCFFFIKESCEQTEFQHRLEITCVEWIRTKDYVMFRFLQPANLLNGDDIILYHPHSNKYQTQNTEKLEREV